MLRTCRRRRRVGHPLARAVVLAWLAATGGARIADAMPFVPPSDETILETVPGASDPQSAILVERTRRLEARPGDMALALEVARLDIAQSRRLGDPRFLGHAEAALAPWPLGPSTPTPVLLLRAVLLQSVHDFDASIAALRRVLAAEPRNAQARLTLASVEQVTADYPGATVECGQLAAVTAGLAPDVCIAAVMALTGHARIALGAITASLAVNADEARTYPAVGNWAMTLSAQIAERLGDASTEARYRAALAADPDEPYLLGAWSDWLLDHGRAAEVETLLGTPARTRIDPLLLRLALAEQATGDPRLEGDVTDLAARFETSRLRGDTIHRREQARFELVLLHAPRAALATAIANWATQREPEDARILLEASRAAGQPGAAAPVRTWLRANRVEDVRLSCRPPCPAAAATDDRSEAR